MRTPSAATAAALAIRPTGIAMGMVISLWWLVVDYLRRLLGRPLTETIMVLALRLPDGRFEVCTVTRVPFGPLIVGIRGGSVARNGGRRRASSAAARCRGSRGAAGG